MLKERGMMKRGERGGEADNEDVEKMVDLQKKIKK